jgi:hypothetical protein
VKPNTRIRLLLALTLLAPVLGRADVFVIASADLTLSADDIRNVYLGEKELAGSSKIVALDNAAAKAEFLSKVVKLDAAKYESLWTKKSFRDGLNPPATKGSDAEVLAAVKSGSSTVGYLSSAPPAGVKLLQKY